MGIAAARAGRQGPWALAVILLALEGCAGAGPRPPTFSLPAAPAPAAPLADAPQAALPPQTPPAPRTTRRVKLGAPYRANGRTYVPAVQPHYDEVGLASWYGAAFHGRPTAIGERFDRTMFSAAHATLPLPCLVEVTNLDNGRRMTLRLNDRGPFHPGRIIDLSEAAAARLGYFRQGTARVRVRYVGPDVGSPSDRGALWPRTPLERAAAPREPAAPAYAGSAAAAPARAGPGISAWSEEARSRLTALVDAQVRSGGGE